MSQYEPPYMYDALNAVKGTTPQAFIRIHNSTVSRFFKKYLFQDAVSVLEWTLPDNWDSDYFRYCLMGFGFVTVFKTDLFGIIPQYCTLSGYNVFYRPTKCLVANPLIGSVELDIGRNCELIRLMPDYGNVSDLVDYYGDLLALTYESLAGNILNSRLAYLIGVDGKPEAETYKAIFDQILSGYPAVVYRKKQAQVSNLSKMSQPDQWQILQQNLKNTFIAPDMLESLNAIRDEFLTAIGVPNLSERKKERVNTIDSERNSMETQSKIDLWLDELNECLDRVKAMFPELENLKVEKRYKPEEMGGVQNGDTAVSGRAMELR